jgi:hypothetical protein
LQHDIRTNQTKSNLNEHHVQTTLAHQKNANDGVDLEPHPLRQVSA